MRTHSIRLIRMTGSLAALAMFAMAGIVEAQSNSRAPKVGLLKEHLIENGERMKISNKKIDALVQHAVAAENDNKFRTASDDFALATVLATSFPRRDSLQLRLRTVVQKELGEDSTKTAQVDSGVAQALDKAFQVAFDEEVHVTKAKLASSGRVVLAEYNTGIQCGACWLHDRMYAALMQRYPSTDFVVLGYHDGLGYPIAYGGDSLWSYINGSGYGIKGKSLYQGLETTLGIGDLGWVDGKAVVNLAAETVDETPVRRYAHMPPVIDEHLRRPPGAKIALTLTPSGISDTSLGSVSVNVRVTPNQPRKRLGVRLVLVEDTVRVTGFTNRRLQYAAVRTVAWFGGHSGHGADDLFSPLLAGSTAPTTVTYTFDVAELQRLLLAVHDSDEEARLAFPDPQTWRMQPRRLGVVAIVQDRDTKEVLQTAYQRVLP